MAITAMGIGTKQAPENVNLDPQRQFWSWLSTFKNPDELGDSGHHERAYFSGFACTQTSPAGMSIQIGGGDDVDSAAIFIGSDRAVLLSTDGTPQTVTIPTAPASGSRIDAVVSYIDISSPSAGDETPGTPEYVHTIVVSGTASGSPSAPTDAQIVSALPAGANAKYYRWCDVRVAQGATTITNSNITDKKPMSPNVYFTTSDVLALAPDWANASTFTANSYTPSANGWIQATYRIDTTQYGSKCSITIAGKSVLNAVNNRDAANYNYTDSIVIPVRKGATVTFSTANGGAFTTRQFVPSVIAT